MKKRLSLLLLALVIMVATGLAQNSQQRKIRLPEKMAKLVKSDKKQTSDAILQHQANKADNQRFVRKLFATGQQQARKAKTTRRAYGDPIVIEQPAGDLQVYSYSGMSYMNTMFGIYEMPVVGAAGKVVFGSDNVVWIKNIITSYECPGWVKGTINGDKITIQLPQPIMESGGYTYYAELLEYDAEDQFYYAKSDETVTLDYDPLMKIITAPEGSALESGNELIGLTDDTSEWYGYGNWAMRMVKFNEKATTAPEDLEASQYLLEADDYVGHIVNLGVKGNEVYVQGIYESQPESWVKGTISDGKVTFKNKTYIGSDTYHQYLVSANEEVIESEYGNYSEYTLKDADITFDYDAATKTLSNGTLCLVNAGVDEVNYAIAYKNTKMSPFVEMPAVPASVTEMSYENMGYIYYADYGYGWGYLNFTLNPTDVDGKFILKDKLTYQLYTRVNGVEKVYEFSPENYINLTEPMTEIPFDFNDGYDIGGGAIYLYINGVDAYGIQTIYRGGGEEHRSEIAWCETGLEAQPEKETPEYPTPDPGNIGSSIKYSINDGSQEMTTIGDGKAQTYDIAIKLQDPTLVGSKIDKISFPVVSLEGVSNLKVWLSTNLRVEDGKNVPNLVELDAKATESGYVDVTLPTPYTISEKGVYVGYSMTIDKVDDYNARPIAVIPVATEGGLYIHTSDVYLKWMDMSIEIGASSIIEVEVSGSSVKDNAAAPKANDVTYVKVGDAINVKTVVSNLGSKGISSLDIDYTLNGNTESKHFDLAEPIAGQMGVTTTLDAQLAAVSATGNYDLTVKVAKVNGVENQSASASAVSPVIVLNTIPKKRTLMEEYTGTWCGWCPRGLVALEKLAELYPDDYVLVSYHNADPMEVLSDTEFPSNVSGYPDAYLDRAVEVDPYYGVDYVKAFGVEDALAERNTLFGYADINIAADLSEDQKSVDIKTTVTFPFAAENVNYGLAYVLVSDNLKGEGGDWSQANYYSGDSSVDDPNLMPLTLAADYIEGVNFCDVAVDVSAPYGMTIEGSIPATIVADQAIENKFSFNLDEVISTSGVNLVQNVKDLKVVAILVNNMNYEVLNANVVKVNTVPTGISTIETKNNSSVVYYNLSGQRVEKPSKGLYIVNGRKVVLK